MYSQAHLMYAWSYREMFAKADFVVIAKAISSETTTERSVLPDLTPATPVVSVLTKFETHLVLKGDKKVTRFILHHYKLATDEAMVNGPNLVEFDPKKHSEFLLFLIRERNGNYAPATDQTDPAGISVIEIPTLDD